MTESTSTYSSSVSTEPDSGNLKQENFSRSSFIRSNSSRSYKLADVRKNLHPNEILKIILGNKFNHYDYNSLSNVLPLKPDKNGMQTLLPISVNITELSPIINSTCSPVNVSVIGPTTASEKTSKLTKRLDRKSTRLNSSH